MVESGSETLVRACALDELTARGRLVFKHGRKQITLFKTAEGIYACNNRCPHEGYPLSEGSISEGCVLTCNWHNWKFDLASGDNLLDGDRLRVYPATLRDGAVWLDLTEAPAADRIAQARGNLAEAVADYDYERMARELARLEHAGGDVLDGLRDTLGAAYDRLEYGMTHAFPAAADWLALRRRGGRGAARALMPVVEAIAHLAWDVRREPRHAYPKRRARYTGDALVDAIEREDERRAVALVRGAYGAGLGFEDLEGPLSRAALAHYQGFGHALIYVYKSRRLTETLGAAVAEPVTLALVRALVYSRREDLIPEFRAYGPALAAGDGRGRKPVGAADFRRLSVAKALARCLASSAEPGALYNALMGANAWNLLHLDLGLDARTDNPVSRNVNWLDVSHGITFANAVRAQCTRHPELWPQGLLQMACFAGRNAGFTDASLDEAPWRVADPAAFLEHQSEALFDHGDRVHIHLAHRLKTLTAALEEVHAAPERESAALLLAGMNRFLNSPLKRRHALRAARQALDFVARE